MADESETDAPMTPRERRRSRANTASKPKAGPSAWKRYKVHLVIVLLFGGLATAMAVNASQTQSCPGHWHSTMDVYVKGDRVSFNHPKYDLNTARSNGGSMSMAMHMHQPDDAMWHWEPVGGADCVELRDALDVVDMELTSSKLVLDGAHEQMGDGGTFTENETHKLSAWHRVGDGEWKELSINQILGRQPQPDERQLIVFGNETGAGLDAFKAKADGNNLQGSSGSQGGASYVPVVGVSIMGLVALGVWHSLSRKM